MFDPRYLTVFGAALTQFTVIGLLFSYGVFFAEFEAEFGWSRTLLSACTAAAFFFMGVLAIFGGRLNDRLGPRPVLMTTGAIYGLGFALISQVQAPWQLLAIFASFLAIGLGTHDVVTLSTIARWFEKRRGVMSGLVKVGTAFGQIAVPPLAAVLILAFGWRDALVVMGLVAAALLVLAALTMSPPPERDPAAPEPRPGLSFAEARTMRSFWTLCAMQFLFFPVLITVPTHIAVHGMDLGLSKPAAAALLSVIGGASIAGRLVVGTLSDRIGGRNAYLVCLACLSASLVALTLTASPVALFAVIAVYGFAHGGLFTVVSPTIAETFGMRAHGAIFGVVVFFGTTGGALGPILAGWVFDTTGSYTPAFVTLAVAAALAAALTRTLPRAIAA